MYLIEKGTNSNLYSLVMGRSKRSKKKSLAHLQSDGKDKLSSEENISRGSEVEESPENFEEAQDYGDSLKDTDEQSDSITAIRSVTGGTASTITDLNNKFKSQELVDNEKVEINTKSTEEVGCKPSTDHSTEALDEGHDTGISSTNKDDSDVRIIGDDNEDSEAIESVDIKGKVSSGISDADVLKPQEELVHTAILENDNPFYDANKEISGSKKLDEKVNSVDSMAETTKVNSGDSKQRMGDLVVRRSENLHNPNLDYEEEDEILVSNTDTNKHSKESSSALNNANMKSFGNAVKSYTKKSGKHVRILEAKKVSEGQSRTFVAYFIKYNGHMVRRRYSDFESLRSILVKLFPLMVIPPIPEKEGLKSYSKAIAGLKHAKYILPSEQTDSVDLSLSIIDQSVSDKEENIIRHRVRILTKFLNRLLDNTDISSTSLIEDFLNPNNSNWNDFVTSSATFSMLPRNRLQANPVDPTNTTRVHACLPIPNTSVALGKRDPELFVSGNENDDTDGYILLEKEHKRYESIVNNTYKYNRRITKNFNEMKHDYDDLAAAFAELSNLDISSNPKHVDFCATFDKSSIAMQALVSNLYYNIDEPLNEAIYNTNAVTELLMFRKLKAVQLYKVEKSLVGKVHELQKLEKGENKIESEPNQESLTSARRLSPIPAPQKLGGSFFNKISEIANKVKESVSYQELDVETQISNLRKEIERLKETSAVTTKDMEVINDTICKEEVPKALKCGEKELEDILASYASYMKTYAKQNLEYWKSIQEAR